MLPHPTVLSMNIGPEYLHAVVAQGLHVAPRVAGLLANLISSQPQSDI